MGRSGAQIYEREHLLRRRFVIAQRQRVLQYLLSCTAIRSGLCWRANTPKGLDDSWVRLRWLIELVRISMQ